MTRAAPPRLPSIAPGPWLLGSSLLVIGLLSLLVSPVLAGKNANGALVVHTMPYSYYNFTHPCEEYEDPGTCENAETQTDCDEFTAALIYMIAAFADGSDPGVTVIYFGHDQNLPVGYHEWWGLCGPPGSLEIPDAGWPDNPATAGNSVAFGAPIIGNRLFPFYWVFTYGFAGAY